MDERRLIAEIDIVESSWYFQEILARIKEKIEHYSDVALSTDEEKRWRTSKGTVHGLEKVDAIRQDIEKELRGTTKFEPRVPLK